MVETLILAHQELEYDSSRRPVSPRRKGFSRFRTTTLKKRISLDCPKNDKPQTRITI
jgi:hypothetical protein